MLSMFWHLAKTTEGENIQRLKCQNSNRCLVYQACHRYQPTRAHRHTLLSDSTKNPYNWRRWNDWEACTIRVDVWCLTLRSLALATVQGWEVLQTILCSKPDKRIQYWFVICTRYLTLHLSVSINNLLIYSQYCLQEILVAIVWTNCKDFHSCTIDKFFPSNNNEMQM